MDLSAHVKCPYCLSVFPVIPPKDTPRHDSFPHGCPQPLPRFGGDDDGLSESVVQPYCYSCGPLDDVSSFSGSQLRKAANGQAALCQDCVAMDKTERFIDYQGVSTISINEELMDVVSKGNVAHVSKLLSEGADANHVRQSWIIDKNRPARAFFPDGTPMPEKDLDDAQPTTPLKLVGFRISDSMLTDRELLALKEIAEMLLAYGARAAPALRHMERRYGAFNPQSGSNRGSFQEVFGMIHAAAERQNFP